jgi:maltooligosyltrehalose trehalohydrolase
LEPTKWPIGSTYLGEGKTAFRVWAPAATEVSVHLTSPSEQVLALEAAGRGYYQALVDGVAPGACYLYRLDDRLNGPKERPDPASRFQPEGVHGAAQVIDQAFPWTDAGWVGPALQDYVQYELHVGTFTPEGTFQAVSSHLAELKELGITVVEIMPVAQFPGGRNWGYDGVYPFAAQNTYGGPDGLKHLVNACHRHGLAVTLDVVYNHLGAEGNYLWDYGPYFTDRYKTAWGSAVNFDGPQSDEVRAYFIENALHWLRDFHLDALRLDAVHAMVDFSAGTFLEELAGRVDEEGRQLGRRLYLIGESDLNDPRIVRTPETHGLGLHAQWADDLHHALHVQLTGEHDGYYRDYVTAGGSGNGEERPSMPLLARALREGYAYTGQHSLFRQRRHGAPPKDIPAHRFVVCSQNHDQVGNRMLGERLTQLAPPSKLQLAAALILLSPFIPLLFMGEEYGETAPFQYFVSHSDPALIEAVREGRRAEFVAFTRQGEPPDPAAEDTFQRSKLDHSLREQGWHRNLWEFYRELLRLRKTLPALRELNKDQIEVLGFQGRRALFWRRWAGDEQAWAVFNFGEEPAELVLPVPVGRWEEVLDSAEWLRGAQASDAAKGTDSGGPEKRSGNVPARQIASDGEVRIEVPALTVMLFESR